MRVMVRACAFSVVALLLSSACGSNATYAGLTRAEAMRLAKNRIEARLDPSKRLYYRASIWNVAAVHGESVPGTPAWLVGVWNGQTEAGYCALARRSSDVTHVQLVSCAAFAKYAR